MTTAQSFALLVVFALILGGSIVLDAWRAKRARQQHRDRMWRAIVERLDRGER